MSYPLLDSSRSRKKTESRAPAKWRMVDSARDLEKINREEAKTVKKSSMPAQYCRLCDQKVMKDQVVGHLVTSWIPCKITDLIFSCIGTCGPGINLSHQSNSIQTMTRLWLSLGVPVSSKRQWKRRGLKRGSPQEWRSSSLTVFAFHVA